MKPKSKKICELDKSLIMVTNLIFNNRNTIEKSSQKSKNKILKEIDLILKINKNIPEYNTLFLEKNKFILLTHKDDLIKLGIYENWIKCYLELSLVMKRKCETFLTKNINVDISSINDIINNIVICLTIDFGFFNDCEQLNILMNKNINHEKCVLFKQIQNSLNIVNDFIKTTILDKNMSVDGITQILDLIKTNITDKKFIEKGVFNWKTISTKIKNYIKNTKPFNIFDIRQTDSVNVIANEILNLLNFEKRRVTNKFIECDKIYFNYDKEHKKITQTEKYKKDKSYKLDANSILTRNIDACVILSNNICILNSMITEANQKIKLIKEYQNDPLKQFDLLADINNFVFDSYNSMISANTDLNIETLKNKEKCTDYQKSFNLSTQWNEICLSVKGYLYYKNIKKIASVGEYKALKFQLKKIITDDVILKNINGYVKTIDKIITRSYEFIKGYVLYERENGKPVPDVTDVDFISMAIRAITINDPRGNNINENNGKLLEKLELFYESHFRPKYGDKYNAVGLSQFLSFCKIQMVTAYTNNIKMNYIKYVKGYMFAIFDEMYKDQYVELNKKDKWEFKKELKKQIDVCVNDVLNGNVCGTHENMKCEGIFKKWIIENIKKIVPENVDFSKNGIEGDLEKNPSKYFEKMIFINIELGKMKRKMFCCFPLRTSYVPSSIDIDTLSIITLFINPEKSDVKEKGISKLLKDNITIFHNKIWEHIVDLKKSQFKWNNKYKFDHHIVTDGISVTILFRHIDMCGLNVHSKQANNDTYKYIDKLGDTEDGWNKELMKEEMKKMCEMYNLLLLDPGKNPDLLYICNYDDNVNNIKYFKYTTKQRLHELGTIKHRKILQNFKKEREINEIEQKLSEMSSKTCIFSNFMTHVENKSKVVDVLREHYTLPFLRKMNLRSYMNKLRSESKLVNNIKSIFGKDDRDIVLIYGDWSRLSQMRGVISTPCIGLKRRLAENFKIFNIDEFRTSCLDNLTFKENKNAKIYDTKTGKKKALHSVLVSNILENVVGNPLKRFQNRNRNSALNMVNIIKHYKTEGIRKPEFSRSFKINTENQTNEKPNFGLPKLGDALTVRKTRLNFAILKCNTSSSTNKGTNNVKV